MIPRLLVLGAVTLVVVGVSVAVTALSFTPRSGRRSPSEPCLSVSPTAAFALAGSLVGQLSATYLSLFAAMLGQGILQSPMFGNFKPRGAALYLPDYGATRIVVGGGFSTSFHAWGELALAFGWLLVLLAVTIGFLRNLLRERIS